MEVNLGMSLIDGNSMYIFTSSLHECLLSNTNSLVFYVYVLARSTAFFTTNHQLVTRHGCQLVAVSLRARLSILEPTLTHEPCPQDLLTGSRVLAAPSDFSLLQPPSEWRIPELYLLEHVQLPS